MMNTANQSGIQSARPVIAVDGRDHDALSGGLLGLSIREDVNGLYCCEALFGNWGSVNNSTTFLYFDRSTLDFGKAFAVKMGSDTIFEGRIFGLEANFPGRGSPQLAVLAEDRFQDLRMTRRSRTFTDLSDADIISQVATEHGLQPDVAVDGPGHTVLAQVNQSDLAFLRERARTIDAEVWMEGSTMHAKSHAGRGGGRLQLTHGSTMREFTALADLAGQRTAMCVCGWDVSGKAALKHEATDVVISSELSGDESGTSILASAFGQRKETLAHAIPLTAREAQTHAESLFKMSARRFVVGRGVTDTDARLRVGTNVDLQGVGPLFSGTYYVSAVNHLFDGEKGLRTEFTAERPGIGRV
jgi:phage protein D